MPWMYSDKPTYCRHWRTTLRQRVQLFLDLSNRSIVTMLVGTLLATVMEGVVSLAKTVAAGGPAAEEEEAAAAGIYAGKEPYMRTIKGEKMCS